MPSLINSTRRLQGRVVQVIFGFHCSYTILPCNHSYKNAAIHQYFDTIILYYFALILPLTLKRRVHINIITHNKCYKIQSVKISVLFF